jgi:mycothiol synthase
VSIALREPTVDDAPALAELLNAQSHAQYGEADLTEDEMRHWFGLPNIWMRVAERDGRLVAYLDVMQDGGGARFHIDARALDEEAAHAIVAAAEQYSGERAKRGAIMRGYTGEREHVRAEYERAGFAVVRHSFHMRIELDEVPEPGWPDGTSVRTFRPEDEDRVWEAMNDAFADSWDYQPPTAEGRAEWRHNFPANPRFDPEVWFLAEDDGEVAGISLCQRNRTDDPTLGWVQTLGVRRAWRRRGLATALLNHSFAELQRRGATRVGLGVDAENPTGALGLYERAGMHVVRRNDTWEKSL